MLPSHRGSIHLFQFAGINVYLHWSWFLIAVFQVSYRMQFPNAYSSLYWCIYEYLALFVIVLMHEFGHSLACRSVGGRADQIVLWPLGGVAYVDPPPRPGATLWSIAAGPLINALLIPIIFMAWLAAKALHMPETNPNLFNLIISVGVINVALLCFNMLPIYPLDGGKIFWALLWFVIGRARSLMVASVVGMITIVGLLLFGIRDLQSNTWLMVIGIFALINCWGGLQQARHLSRVAAAPRRTGLACPKCHAPPPIGSFWICGRCRSAFDMFETRGVCPKCGTIFNATRCLECGEPAPLHSYGDLNS
jgi:Zn-dependent protease